VKAKSTMPFFIIGKLFDKTDPLPCKEVRDTHKPDTKKLKTTQKNLPRTHHIKNHTTHDF